MGSPSPGLPAQMHTCQSEEMFQRLSDLLERGLTGIALRITTDIRKDFQALGDRMDAIELKMDRTTLIKMWK